MGVPWRGWVRERNGERVKDEGTKKRVGRGREMKGLPVSCFYKSSPVKHQQIGVVLSER